jgi:hypothetical protein
VNRLKSAHSCRICRRWLEGEWARADETGRHSIQRQMDNGMCDGCQRKRQSAAQEYIAAAGMICLSWQWTMQTYGEDAVAHDPTLIGRSGPGRNVARDRMADAARRCRSLRMWR